MSRYFFAGDTGPHVGEVQARLVATGRNIGTWGPAGDGIDEDSGNPDGSGDTMAALADYQRTAGVAEYVKKPEGWIEQPAGIYAGPRTWAALGLGPKGETGSRGADGAAGSQGPAGPQGREGARRPSRSSAHKRQFRIRRRELTVNEWKKILREPVTLLGTTIAVAGYVLIELGDSAPRWLAHCLRGSVACGDPPRPVEGDASRRPAAPCANCDPRIRAPGRVGGSGKLAVRSRCGATSPPPTRSPLSIGARYGTKRGSLARPAMRYMFKVPPDSFDRLRGFGYAGGPSGLGPCSGSAVPAIPKTGAPRSTPWRDLPQRKRRLRPVLAAHRQRNWLPPTHHPLAGMGLLSVSGGRWS